MPLLRRQVLEKAPVMERLKDSDEVLYCEMTGEIFSNYEDYFHRMMLISSMVWSCSMTGRPNLTYAEALESERAAKKVLKTFPAAVRGPFLLVASHTKRSAINEMHEDVYGYIKDQIFKGEIVDALDDTINVYRRALVLKAFISNSNNNQMTYHVTSRDDKQPNSWYIQQHGIRRDRSSLTREKCKLFLKQHVEAGPGGQLRIKQESLDKYVHGEGWTNDEVFFGKVPDFEQSKKLKTLEERAKDGSASGATKKKASSNKHGQTTGDGDVGTIATGSSGKQKVTKSKKSKESAETSDAATKGKKEQDVKEKPLTKKQLKGDKRTGKKSNADALALLQINEEREAIMKKRAEEEKALLMQQITLALKRYNAVLDDQELVDQRPIPPVRPVKTLVTTKYFGNFVFILEFMNSFSDLLALRSKFPSGLTMHLLERALLLREVNGPLSDIMQVLMNAIFTKQVEEENEMDMRYDRVENLAHRRLTVPDQARAIDTILWCEKHYCAKLQDLPMDTLTVSELVRLHFLSSGALVEEKAAKHRFYNRGGYVNAEDPGLRLVQDYPHIIRALRSYSVYQLSINDVIQVLCCLIHQLLTYTGVRELSDERIERARVARNNYQANRYAQRRLLARTGSQKNQARDDMKKELATFEGSPAEKKEYRAKLQQRLDEQCVRLDAETQHQLKQLQAQSDKLKEDFFDYQVYLGTDRCFRSYWLFESLPGLFVEHNHNFAGRCADQVPVHIPGLANCPSDQRRKYITKAIMKCAGTDCVALLLDAKAIATGISDPGDGSGTQVNEVYDELLAIGSAALERTSRGGKKAIKLTNHELLMCTADPEDCPVHTIEHDDTVIWGYYATADELDALIQSLNVHGTREKALRDTLECERDLIVAHIEKSPIEKLSMPPHGRDTALIDIVNRSQKRYDAPNFNHDPGSEPNEILEAVLCEHILELEEKITAGYLGVMRVNSRELWREALDQQTYDPQTTEPLQWGPKRLSKMKNKEKERDPESDVPLVPVVEHGSDNGSDCDDPDQLHSIPGDLPDTSCTFMNETQKDNEFTYTLHESEELLTSVRNLARALLQVSQCIEQKFLRHPFGPKKDHKDRNVMLQKQHEGLRNLVLWEASLMQSTSYSQIFLHYNVLYDAIYWSRSAERICCMTCRRKGDPGLTLLCDECNRACHIYCLKPKLKEVPAGDWFCKRCRPENFKVSRASSAKQKKLFKWHEDGDDADNVEVAEPNEEEVAAEEEEEEEDEEEAEEEEEGQQDDEENGVGNVKAQDEEEAEDEEMADDEQEKEDGADEEEVDEEEEEYVSETASDNSADDNGSDEDYQVGTRTKASGLGTKNKSKSSRAKPVGVTIRVSGRRRRSTAVMNGIAKRNAQNDDDDADDVDADVSDDERDDNPFKRGGLSNGGSRSSAAKRPKRGSASQPSNAGKRSRRSLPAMSVTNGNAPQESESERSPRAPRISARISKGQRRSSMFNGNPDPEVGSGNIRRSRRTGDDLPLNSVALYTLIDDILKHSDSWPFNRPVSAKEVPDYYAVIKNPMDFARVKSKLNMGDYTINEQMLNDVQLVFRNCDLYNTDETDIYRTGRRLEEYVVRRCKELGLPFQPSDMQKLDSSQNGPYSVNGGLANKK